VFKRWQDLVEYYRSRPWRNWIFRGQESNRWELSSTLERAAVDRFRTDWQNLPRIEDGLLRRFQRQLHQYVITSPAKEDTIEWYALMRHYGAPTRLLDWTYSFFVAAYFAFESAKPGSICAIWALDSAWWGQKARAALPGELQRRIQNEDPNLKCPDTIKAILKGSPPIPLIHPLNPFRLNDRLVAQQGVFLAPGDITRSFMDNIRALCLSNHELDRLIKLEIKCNTSLLIEALEDLHRMNVNRAALFPGLEGFARQLEQLIAIPHALAVDREP